MCLYPKLIKNRKYTSNKKNGGVVPAVTDVRTLYVPIGCGKCIECTKQRTRNWQIRLLEEIRTNHTGKFITLTFSNESIKKIICENKELQTLNGYKLDNAIATKSVRLWLERWRKKYKKSLRHWLVTELGHNGTENIHIHGIVWTTESYAEIRRSWGYGYIWPRKDNEKGTYVTKRTINYLIKYINKIDQDHKLYKPITLTSPGMGANYLFRLNAKRNEFKDTKTIETYITDTGHEMSLPIYYRNKLYKDEEKEKLWLNRLDKNERWVCGVKIKADDTNRYYKLLEINRKKNTELGYGDDAKNWELEEYEKARRDIMHWKRLNPNGYPAEWDK